jgi:hypothetical protein
MEKNVFFDNYQVGGEFSDPVILHRMKQCGHLWQHIWYN